MTRRRQKARAAPARAGAVRASEGESARRGAGILRELDVLAIASAVVCLLFGYATRHSLNPDGVSYLDIAGAASRGEWSAFVQGYWSPAYPLVLALAMKATGATAAALVPVVHAINVLIALVPIALIWRVGRANPDPFFGRLALGAYMVCSARPPRTDAVTPDQLLVLFALLLCHELLTKRGRRWVRIGLWAGLAFLCKTSSWPWLVVLFVFRLWSAARERRFLPVVLSAGVAAVIAMLWIVPLSIKEGRATLGSAGALNYCWYLEACDSRSPDTHRGEHAAYRTSTFSSGPTVRWAEFPSEPRFTYAPWSDPTRWSEGVRTRAGNPPSAMALLRYWFNGGRAALTLWFPATLLGVMLPALVIGWRRGMARELWHEHRESLAVLATGAAGLAQFVAIHVEPRLMAPLVVMISMAWIHWTLQRGSSAASGFRAASPSRPAGAIGKLLLSYLSFAYTIGVTMVRLPRDAVIDTNNMARTADIAQQAEVLRAGGVTQERIAIAGPAMPVLSDVWSAGGRVVGQVLPLSANELGTLPWPRQRELYELIFRGKAGVVWLTQPDGRFRMLPVPPP